MSNEYHNQHFIPKFYLKGFVNKNNRIWCYEKCKGGIVSELPLDKAGSERDFYSFINEVGKLNHLKYEKKLQKQERKFAPLLAEILRQKDDFSFDDHNRTIFAEFVKMMMVRVPSYIQYSEKTADRDTEKAMSLIRDKQFRQEFSKSIQEATGRKLTETELTRGYLIGIANFNSRKFSLESLMRLEIFATTLNTMKWTFIGANDELKFITSDTPVLACNPERKIPYRIGIGKKVAEVRFPLSKDVVFIAHWKDRVQEGWFKAKNHLIKRVNSGTTLAATRFIYSSSNDKQLREFIDKRQYTLPYFNTERDLDSIKKELLYDHKS